MRSRFSSMPQKLPQPQRRGAVLVLAAVIMVILLGFVAFTVDVGHLALTRSQLQNAADAAAMAGTWELLHERRLREGATSQAAAIAEAKEYIGHHWAGGKQLQGADQNVAFGYLTGDRVFVESGDFARWDSLRVRIGRTPTDNGALQLFFAPAIGSKTANVTAESIATFRGAITAFRPTAQTGVCSVIPFTVHVDAWKQVQSGMGNDNWSYDTNSRQLSAGSDRIHELLLFPARTGGAGNFGALTIGASVQTGNARLIQQIAAGGLSANDLRSYGGELRLDSLSGTLVLSGDTGTTTDILRAAQVLIGRAVTFPLYSRVDGKGTNAQFTIVGFAGARVLDVRTTGGQRGITVQPAVVVDRTAIPGGTSSWNVYQPVKLTH